MGAPALSVQGAGDFLIRPAELSDAAEISAVISDPSFHVAVATLDGRIVGMVTVKNRSRIYQFFVGRAHAGLGVGRSLWNIARNYCLVENPEQTIAVNSSSFAEPIYSRFGFERTGATQESNGCISIPMEYRGKR